MGLTEKPGDGIGGGGSAGGGSERRRLRDLLLFMNPSGFSFLRDSVVRLDSAECMLNVSDGRAVDVVETLTVEAPVWRGDVKELNDGLCEKPKRCEDDFGGGVGYRDAKFVSQQVKSSGTQKRDKRSVLLDKTR